MIRTMFTALLSQLRMTSHGQCQVCGCWPEALSEQETSETLLRGLCAACERRFAPRGLLRCWTCAQRLPSAILGGDAAQPVCGTCIAHPPLSAHTVAPLDYGYPWADWVARLKFRNDVGLARTLGALMAHDRAAEPLLLGAQAVVPVPRSRERMRERGYNPAALLAQAALAARGQSELLHAGALRRWRHGPSQRELDAEARKTNVLRAFEPIAKNTLQGLTVVLVDDLWTTGATLNAVARAALDAGAAQVRCWVLARTPLE